MKRYEIYPNHNGTDVVEAQEKYGDYVRWEDIEELLNWLGRTAEIWKSTSYVSDSYDLKVGQERAYEECADEIEEKLKEINKE